MDENEYREQRLHDAKMARWALEEAEKDQLVKDGNRLADALVKSREEVAQLKLQIELLSKGIHDNTTYPEPLINGSAVETAIALLKDRQEKIRLNRELQNRVEMLTASLESILKRELGLDFQTYLDSKAAMPLTRVLLDEVIDKLPDFIKKPKCETCAAHGRNKDAGCTCECHLPEPLEKAVGETHRVTGRCGCGSYLGHAGECAILKKEVGTPGQWKDIERAEEKPVGVWTAEAVKKIEADAEKLHQELTRPCYCCSGGCHEHGCSCGTVKIAVKRKEGS